MIKLEDGGVIMNLGKTLALVAILATVWGVTYMHDRAHRYDIVAAGSGGSGGSQQSAGETGDIKAYLVDHKTGKVWFIQGLKKVLTVEVLFDCPGINTESGCQMQEQK